MKKKIIITGGLGYIGTELCKLYSGVSWHHKVVVIDNRFISERVNQLRNWNMEFIQGDILDKELIKQHTQMPTFIIWQALSLEQKWSSDIKDKKIKNRRQEQIF